MPRRSLAAVAAILVYFCFFMRVGYRMPYSFDDVTNLYLAWTIPARELLTANLSFWPPSTRPFGALVYRVVYAVFGFHPRPLYWIVWLILILNLWLAWRLFRQLGAGREASLLGVLIFAAPVAFSDLSYNAGTLYDSLCFTFFVLALLICFRSRSRWVPAALAGLVICALNSKEMAVTLPVVLLVWGILFHPPVSWRRGVVVTGAIVAAFLIVRLGVQGPLTGSPDYTPVLAWDRFAASTNQYLAMAFYGSRPMPGVVSVLIYAAMLGVAVALRSRLLLFCFLWFPITLLPVSFVRIRPGYVLYIPLLLWSLYFATVLVRGRDWLLRRAPVWSQTLLFVVVAAGLCLVNQRTWPAPPSFHDSAITRTALQFAQMYPRMSSPSRLLFLEDPYPESTWALLFTLRLLYHDRGIEVHRLNGMSEERPASITLSNYDHIFLYRDGRYIELAHGRELTLGEHVSVVDSNFALHTVKDVMSGDGDSRWTNAEPAMRFRLTSIEGRLLVVRFDLAGETLRQTGAKTISFFVNDHELARRRYERGGEQVFSERVPAEWLRTDALTTVTLKIDPPYVAAADGVKLGVLLKEIGFRLAEPGEYVEMSEVDLARYIVRGVLGGKGDSRWTNEEAELRFRVGAGERKLNARFVVADATLKRDGAKTVTFFVNGNRVGGRRYEREGEQVFSERVPGGWIRRDAVNSVVMRVEPAYVGEDGVRLGVVLKGIGFRGVGR